MPSFNIVKETNPVKSFRADSVIGAFDIDIKHIKEEFKGNIDIEDKEWNIGLIVGGSGTGKSTIAREVFTDYYIKEYKYKADCVLDDFPKEVSIKDIQKTFTNVGFASPPSWLKPYNVLSNGEKMRVDLARAILENKDIIVFDEFTSVVNREVAKTGSYAISKAVKRANKKFIAVTCHKDVKEWLEPDWIYDTDKKEFFFIKKQLKDQKSNLKYTELTTVIKKECGRYLESIII
jgi:ABC-type ATPase with predicted acetyltransferase domain